MIDLSLVKTITVFGSGITAKAVKATISKFNQFKEVEASQNPDIGILSPGLNTEEYRQLHSFPLISEIEFAYLLIRYLGNTPFYITISGTNGKTTTTHLTGDLLNIPLAGNIGLPLISYVEPAKEKIPELFALEISSYQLEQSPTFAPNIYILMNITPDHLDRHKTMENYATVKLSPLARMTDKDYFIYNGKDEWIVKRLALPEYKNLKVNLIDFQKEKSKYSDEIKVSPLLGEHNVDNLVATLCAVTIVRKASYIDLVKKIKNIPHRLEAVGIVSNITFINDSKGTNPDSTIAAINSVEKAKIILLLGGQRKKVSYASMVDLIKKQRIRVLTFGEAGSFFDKEFVGYGYLLGACPTMVEAVDSAYKYGKKGDIVLLSPSCASFDEFSNYEERGDVFREHVSKLSTKH